jgi:BirA family biotin operon repressor/biotin-[acetyl-CoA-carboxylase] ligase
VHSDLDVFCCREIDSTNNEAKRLASTGLSRPALVVAESQTAGRGRNGRAFYSPQNTGLYMTLALRPRLELFDAVLITTAAAVAVVRAIEALTTKNRKSNGSTTSISTAKSSAAS